MTTYTVSGTITAGGLGLAGASVSDGTRSAITASDGTYTISAVPAGSYTLTPTKAGASFSPATLAVEVVDAALTGKDFNGYVTFMIGTSLVGLTDLMKLTQPVPYPKSTYHPWSKPVALGDGSIRGLGWKTITWFWKDLKPAEIEQLRTFCAGASAEVYIVTRQNVGDAFMAYKAVMIWPEEDRDFLRRMDIEFKFQRLELQA
jgi:hypothetical protein